MSRFSLLPCGTARCRPQELVRGHGPAPRGLLCAAAIVLSTVACETTIPEVEDTALVTDGTSFQLDSFPLLGHMWYEVQIPYSFTNRTGSKVYLENCRGLFDIRLQTKVNGEWAGTWGPALPDCLSAPIVIEPDEVYETILDLVGCTSGGSCAPVLDLTRVTSAPARIMWGTGLSSYDADRPPFGKLIPLEERVSNSFTLQVPR